MKPAWSPFSCTRPGLSFDLFCRVVDNYGDIGVAWRLARQLARNARAAGVRLWVDDLVTFQRIAPAVNAAAAAQALDNVHIVRWSDPAPRLPPGNVTIELFGCSPPADHIARMPAGRSVWLNLEYLSAESWVSDFHLQASPQAGGRKKFFFFPGFMPGTGGLLREPGLLARRDRYQTNTANPVPLLQSLGVPQRTLTALRQGARRVFLFCYPDAPVHTLLDVLAADPHPTVLLAPHGVARDALQAHETRTAGDLSEPGRLRIARIPFVEQTRFDALLWGCDLNIVRGEDSLVRALWAGRPMIWQPYPQEDQAHLDKLDALLACSPLQASQKALLRAWSAPGAAPLAPLLRRHLASTGLDDWRQRTATWSAHLAAQPDLVTSLLDFCTAQLRSG